MCLVDLQVARGIAERHLRSMSRARQPRRRRAVATAVAGVVLLVPALGGCGDDETSKQTTAVAVTEASSAAEATGDEPSAADEPGADPDEPSADPDTDRDRVTATLETVLQGGNAEQICDRLVTGSYLKQAYGDDQGCVNAQSKKAAAAELEIGEIAISPEGVAQTSVRVKGGIYDKQRLRAVLVLQDGEWKLDSLRSNVPVGP